MKIKRCEFCDVKGKIFQASRATVVLHIERYHKVKFQQWMILDPIKS